MSGTGNAISDRLRRRARWMRYQALVVLVIICGTIAAGIYVFRYADELADDAVRAAAETIAPVAQNAGEQVRTIRDRTIEINASVTQMAGRYIDIQQRLFEVEDGLRVLTSDLVRKLSELEQNLGPWDRDQVSSALGPILDPRRLSETPRQIEQLARDSQRDLAGAGGCVRDLATLVLNPAKLKQCIARLEGVEAVAKRLDAIASRAERYQDQELASLRAEAADSVFKALVPVSFSYESEFQTIRNATATLSATIGEARSTLGQDAPAFKPTVENPSELSRIVTQLEAANLAFAEATGNAPEKPSEMLDFVSATTVRITAVVLIVFLVQIFVNLFRYTTRLAAFYEARADALDFLAAQNLTATPDDYQKMVMALAPDGLDFGKGPRSPTDQAVEIARHLAMATKRV